MDNVSKKQSVINSGMLIVVIVIAVLLTIIGYIATDKFRSVYSYSEAGYLITKTTENSFYYEFDGDSAHPEFKDEYYFTVLVDDNYIKFKIPYKIFIRFNLGDHITVYRKYNPILDKYSDYSGVILDIKVPAKIL